VRRVLSLRARFLAQLVKTLGFGMTLRREVEREIQTEALREAGISSLATRVYFDEKLGSKFAVGPAFGAGFFCQPTV